MHRLVGDETLPTAPAPRGGAGAPSGSFEALLNAFGRQCAHAVLRHAGEDLSKKPFLELIGLSVVAALATIVPDTTAFSTYVTMWLGAGIANTTVCLLYTSDAADD